MSMFNITEIRQNASKIIAHVLKTKEPVVILQRSKPVAYIVEAQTYKDIQEKLKKAEHYEKVITTRNSLQRLARLRSEMKKQPDSTPLIRRLREGDARRDE
ncbi:type II toxin-antitoxin system Phd/YefM family antitoxin [Desulfoscipio gibsoniae]|uniref:Antitoxin n=1 Tax=Desulfoscipio gibsoniae DSM 7213 TaxID=767817 RepID=G6IBR4_9FIRM|nr:type II toxin-antitoxin system Phd/YefM family antitoxin [Desulfoscipio gibsoniae]AGK99798.1 prevent-host-death family protein [Desulfoscipio gibsoniae DSM 7213]AGK99808.1 prevent-host-death family protein [Desulfoscipio gibsoniae DSM 7213]